MQFRNEEERKLWKKVQVGHCLKVILLFIGIILMQMLAYMLCTLGYAGYLFLRGVRMPELIQQLAQYMSDSGSMLMWVSAVSAALCLVWCGILYRKSSWREEKISYRKVFSVYHVLGIFGVGMGACIGLTVLLSGLFILFPAAFENYRQMMSHVEYDSSIITVPYVLLIGPASEEMIFRGAMMDRLRIAFPFWLANLLQAALFGIYHMNLIQGVYAFCLGVVLGMIIKVTGSILASMLTHCIFNTTSYVFGFLSQRMESGVVMGLVVLGAVSALIFGLRHFVLTEQAKDD